MAAFDPKPTFRRADFGEARRGESVRQYQRRYFLFSAGALAAAPFACFAQTPQTPRRIGILAPSPSQDPRPPKDRPFNRELTRLGYTLGKNLLIEVRYPK